MLKEMEYHKEDCAHLQGAWIATRTGECWHLRACSTLSGTPEEHLRWYRRCTVCMENLPPPDREDRFFGGTIADDIQAWLAGPWSSPLCDVHAVHIGLQTWVAW